MYLYELPTTGAILFSDICVDLSADRRYSQPLQEVTQSRANIRGALKESKHVGHPDKDNLKLLKLIEDYIPQLLGLMNRIDQNEIRLSSELVFSWRTTLSSNLFNTSPRLSVPTFTADLAFVLLTYGYALSNLARSYVAALDAYGHDQATAYALDRKSKDEQLSVAVSFLRRASGIFSYVGENVLANWTVGKPGSGSNFKKPPDLIEEVSSALAKMSLADGQTLAIRKLLSQASSESSVAPGPPLPKSHPSPMLLAKLHLECASLYSSARSLIKNLEASKSDVHGDVSSDLRRYLAEEAAFHGALSKKWLGVDAGENGGANKGGEAVAFVAWAKKELLEVKDSSNGINRGKVDKEQKTDLKNRVALELNSITLFHKHYQKMNDTVHFQPVPSQADIQRRVPVGRLVVEAQQYVPPPPVFGPASSTSEQENMSHHELEKVTQPLGSYAGAGSYF